jgi:CHAT domain-containing protein
MYGKRTATRAILIALALALGGADAAAPAEPVADEISETDGDSFNQVSRLVAEGKLDQAEPAARQLLERTVRTYGADSVAYIQALQLLGTILDGQQRLEAALGVYERAFATDCFERKRSCTLPADLYYDLAVSRVRNLMIQRRVAEAEKAVGIANWFLEAEGIAAPDTTLQSLYGTLLLHSWRARAAAGVFDAVLRTDEKIPGIDPRELAIDHTNLAGALSVLGNYPKAIWHTRKALELRTKALGEVAVPTVKSRSDLASYLASAGDWAGAKTECGHVQASMIVDAMVEGLFLKCVDIVTDAMRIGGDAAGAEQLFLQTNFFLLEESALGPFLLRRAIFRDIQNDRARAAELYAEAAEELGKGAEVPDGLYMAARLGEARANRRQGRPQGSLAKLRLLSPAMARVARAEGQATSAAGGPVAAQPRSLFEEIALSAQAWADRGGGEAAADRPEALKSEAFEAAQLALASAAGSATQWALARAVAGRQGRGEIALRREELLDRIASADRRETRLMEGAASPAARAELSEIQQRAAAELRTVEARLRHEMPDYWDLISPAAIPIAELQGRSGTGAALLGPDEVLVLILEEKVAAGNPGTLLVFAVSREDSAWARAGMDSAAVAQAVRQLRCGLDSASCRSGSAGPFSRKVAYDLYRALFGNRDIARVVKPKPRMLVAANGALTSLPLTVLVTAPPEGPDDDDAFANDTDWLVETKTVATLPGVASLRALRSRDSGDSEHGTPPVPFVGFAPQFEGPPDRRGFAGAAPARYYEDGDEGLARIRALPGLPSNQQEIKELRDALGGGEAFVGPEATEAQVHSWNEQGRLAQARIVAFATHGLLSGDFPLLVEPALALTPPRSPAAPSPERNDGLMTASEIAGLRLDADWVVLSACNTGGGDSPGAEGLSGLARAFLYAGARTLLVSHWRVDDSAARYLTTQAVALSRGGAMDHAEALRTVQRKMIDGNASIAPLLPGAGRAYLANPALWAPFSSVGR